MFESLLWGYNILKNRITPKSRSLPLESMLNDAIINKAQTLLHEQIPGAGGLEDTTLGPVGMFSIQKRRVCSGIA